MDTNIRGRVALVGGAGAGIGLASARLLAAEGAHVVLVARGRERLEQRAAEIAAEGGRADFLEGDLSRTDELPGLFARALALAGPIDILVNNSGGPPTGDPLSFSDEDWMRAFRGTFLSAEALTRLALPAMAERGWGRVINLASISVVQPLRGLVLSNAIRMAVVGWGRTLAREYAARGVTVNTIATGLTLTDRLAEVYGDPVRRQEAAARIPAGRMARPEEVAAAVVFLASEAAAFITGVTLPVDGGQTIGG